MKKNILWISLAVLGLLTLSNPSSYQHRTVVKNAIVSMVPSPAPFDPTQRLLATIGIAQMTLSLNQWEVENYVVFSCMRSLDGKLVTLGILGKVFYFGP